MDSVLQGWVPASGDVRQNQGPLSVGRWDFPRGDQQQLIADLACELDQDGERVSTLLVHDANSGRLRRFSALLVKEFVQIVRDPSSILIAFVLPLILLFAISVLFSIFLMLLLKHGIYLNVPILATSMIRYKKYTEWIQTPTSRRLLHKKSIVRLNVEMINEDDLSLEIISHPTRTSEKIIFQNLGVKFDSSIENNA